jgi:hypothetical protein
VIGKRNQLTLPDGGLIDRLTEVGKRDASAHNEDLETVVAREIAACLFEMDLVTLLRIWAKAWETPPPLATNNTTFLSQTGISASRLLLYVRGHPERISLSDPSLLRTRPIPRAVHIRDDRGALPDGRPWLLCWWL